MTDSKDSGGKEAFENGPYWASVETDLLIDKVDFDVQTPSTQSIVKIYGSLISDNEYDHRVHDEIGLTWKKWVSSF